MTIHGTLKAIRALGLAAVHADGEYRINIRQSEGGTEATAYYTTDSDDAVATAKYMAAYKAAWFSKPSKPQGAL